MNTADVTDNSPEWFEQMANDCTDDVFADALRAAAAQAREIQRMRANWTSSQWTYDEANTFILKGESAESANRALQRAVESKNVCLAACAAFLPTAELINRLNDCVAYNRRRQAMTDQPKVSAEALLQALNYCLMPGIVGQVLKKARELTAATPAPDAAGDAVQNSMHELNRKQAAMYCFLREQAGYMERGAITWRVERWENRICKVLSGFELDAAIEAALANPPQSAGAGDGVEGEKG